MNKYFLLTSMLLLTLLMKSSLADNKSNETSEIYKQEFELEGTAYDVKVRRSEKGELLIFSNNTDVDFLLFSGITNQSQTIFPKSGYATECDASSIIESSFILSTSARDFEETLTLKCGDSVVIRKLK